jgi:hypothetical protein
LANAFGSELIKLPVKLTAQYWTGSAWENNSEDSDSVLPASAAFTSCKGALNTGGGACVPLVPLNSVSLAKGAGTMWLQAPGAGKTGSASMQLKTTPSWLPSTIGRVTFGVYKSTFIYIREVY